MKTMIVYDSAFGNTEKIATTVRGALRGDVTMVRPAQARPADIAGIDLLILASPTLGGRPTEAIQAFLNKVPAASLRGLRVAALDTRLSMKFARLFGYAADKMASSLVKSGGVQAAAPEGFIVKGRRGPLAAGEIERAAAWAQGLAGAP
ncbi:MAG TPA: flavodoxin domain-containing protein [Spirochaetia bacterium]|nr:flavodoxin domain-containing protein [Spirochaetia bacterium]